MSERLENTSEIETNDEEIKKLGEAGVTAAELHTALVENMREDVAFWAEEYKSIEKAFISNEIRDKDEFELWERDAAEAFHKMEEAAAYSDFKNIYEKDNFEAIAKVAPSETIEAKSGQYYKERNQLIIEAIKEKASEEDRDKELETVYGLHQLAAYHIEAQKDYDSRTRDPDQYQAVRRAAHNNLIKGLNAINHIAEKYGAKRLIFRDFETNDFAYFRNLDNHGECEARAEYDRSCVENYIRIAFSRDFEAAERENIKTNRSDSIVAMFHNAEDY